MNIQKHFLGAVLAALGISASATPHSLPLPPPSAYVDTESSTNVVFSGWNDLTRFVKIHAEVFASLATCVQVALGTDRNNDGALAVEETDLVLGYDCGKWFIRDERNCREWIEDASNLLSGDFVSRAFTALTAPRYDGIHQENGMVFSREWYSTGSDPRVFERFRFSPRFGIIVDGVW